MRLLHRRGTRVSHLMKIASSFLPLGETQTSGFCVIIWVKERGEGYEMSKKPIYKKWWFWVIVVLLLATYIGATSDNPEETTNNNDENDQIENNNDNNNENNNTE